MVGLLDTFRDMLEDLGGGLGVTDPVSGDTVVERSLKAKPAAKRKTGKATAKKQPTKKAKKSTRSRGR
jgi:hypothetical protein